MLQGRDLSHWDGSRPDLTGLSFALLKAGQGLGGRPAAYADHLDQVRARKLIEGSYHFLTRDNGAAQAQKFQANTAGAAEVHLYAVDVEVIDETTGEHPDYAHLKDFHETFHRLFPRRYLFVYSYLWFWENTFGNPVHDCPWCVLWASALHPSWPAPYGGFRQVTLHQYATIPVDRDQYDGSWADLAVLGSQQPAPAPKPKPKPVPKGDTPLLVKGMAGQKIADVQHALDLLGNDCTVDGIGHFGAETFRVLEVFQRHRGLKVTGTTTPETWRELRLVAHPKGH